VWQIEDFSKIAREGLKGGSSLTFVSMHEGPLRMSVQIYVSPEMKLCGLIISKT
jgi:hypothetical protein